MKTFKEFLTENTQDQLEHLADKYGMKNIIDAFTDALGLWAEEVGDKDPVKADKIDRLADHSQWEKCKKFAPGSSSGAKWPTDELYAFFKKDGAYSVLDDLVDICGDKAEHLRSNWDDEESAKIWEQLGEQLGKLLPAIPKH